MSAFGEAFKSARKSGVATFTWQGKKYTTETREEKSKRESVRVTHPEPVRVIKNAEDMTGPRHVPERTEGGKRHLAYDRTPTGNVFYPAKKKPIVRDYKDKYGMSYVAGYK